VVAVEGRLRVEGPFPNPVSGGSFRLQLTSQADRDVSLFLYDALGRQVASVIRVSLRANRPRIVRVAADVTERFASGLYFVRLVGEELDTAVPVLFAK
jgi:hypothetical protein